MRLSVVLIFYTVFAICTGMRLDFSHVGAPKDPNPFFAGGAATRHAHLAHVAQGCRCAACAIARGKLACRADSSAENLAKAGAACVTRTRDPRITNAMLYRLS